MSYADPRTGKDEPPKGYRVTTLGPDFAQLPYAWWGERDKEQAANRNQPLGKALPPPAPERTIPPGFSLFPDRQHPPLTKGERAVQEIRSKRS